MLPSIKKRSFKQQLLKILSDQITRERTISQQILLSFIFCLCGYVGISWAYQLTQEYLPSILILTIVLNALFVSTFLTLTVAAIMPLVADYFFIIPLGTVLYDHRARIHFLTLFLIANIAGLLITAIRQIYREAVTARKDAEQARISDRAKSTFVATMSREIRTPLTSILGYTQLLLDEKLSAAERKKYTSSIKRNSELVSVIINDVIDISKMEAGQLDISVVKCSLDEILGDFRNGMNNKAKEKGISLKLTVDESVPSYVRTDPVRLRQILLNVVGNAIKFTTEGSVQIDVKMITRLDARPLLLFQVADTGRGIQREQFSRLFKPFTQAHSDSVGGMGLGLALSRRLANLLGGEVELFSTWVGKGSVFNITIDPNLRDHRTQPRKPAPMRLVDSDKVLKDVRVLLVDDCTDTQDLVCTLLSLEGAIVEIAGNGQEAFERIRMGAVFDVLLLDLQMPVMNGYQTIDALRNSQYVGKVVAFSAHAMSEERDRCLQNGFDGYLSKPFTRAEIVDAILTAVLSTGSPEQDYSGES